MRILGHGVDIVAVARVGRMLEEHGDRFLERVFTAEERAYVAAAAGSRRAEHLAARFAAKEAAMKALGIGWTRGVAWTDVGVSREASGRPALSVTGRFADLARSRGVSEWWLSLSHTEAQALASVIAVGEGESGDPSE